MNQYKTINDFNFGQDYYVWINMVKPVKIPAIPAIQKTKKEDGTFLVEV